MFSGHLESFKAKMPLTGLFEGRFLMNKIKLKHFFLFLLPALLLTCSKQPLAPELPVIVPDDGVVARLDMRIPELMRQAKVPGLSIAILKDAEVFWTKGFGIANAQTKDSVSINTVFEAASISKPVFAYAVLQLYERGIIGLDVPLTRYWPERYIPNEPRLDLIPTRIVLSHTTGFPNWREDKPLTIRFTPGTRFGYSGEGYMYLQKVIEHITNRSLNDLAVQTVFTPLGMDNSSYVWRDDYELLAATGHDRNGHTVEKTKPTEGGAAYSLHSTVLDLAKFISHLMKMYTGNEAAEKTIFDLMLTPQIQVNSHIYWGLGWGIEKTEQYTSFWHWGDNGSFRCFAVGYPKEKIAVVILTNSENAFEIIEDIVKEAIGGKHPAFEWLGY
jgi:CubicO group peptidase (beta-lactamase class C family)